MKYFIALLLFTSPALAETCKDKFPGSIHSMSFKTMGAYEKCLDEENAKAGILVDLSSSRKLSNDFADSVNRQKADHKRELAESERAELLRQQNQLLKERNQNDLDFQNRVLDEIEN